MQRGSLREVEFVTVVGLAAALALLIFTPLLLFVSVAYPIGIWLMVIFFCVVLINHQKMERGEDPWFAHWGEK